MVQRKRRDAWFKEKKKGARFKGKARCMVLVSNTLPGLWLSLMVREQGLQYPLCLRVYLSSCYWIRVHALAAGYDSMHC